ncbi:MAG: PBP1A family penicillin-binding protein [Bacteroidota bacterium]|jgi:penicillin-binding protein 1A|nr:PBP1A family penicillin-binding protein [Bacteroidota bacterium]
MDITPRKFWSIIAPAFILLVGGWWFLSSLTEGLPSLEELENPRPPYATRVYSADGLVIDRFFEENRSRLNSLDSVPTPFIEALLSTEDRRFYEHWGVDVRGVARVVIDRVFSLSLRGRGASTITQQLARLLYLTREVTIMRKLREMLTAVQIERRYTKEEILIMYLNVAPFGRGAYGLQSAAAVFFNKKPAELTVSECAFLVGALSNPTRYDPRRNYEGAVLRRNTVMMNMIDEGYLDASEFAVYRQDSIVTQTRERTAGIAPHFVEYVRQLLREKAERYGFDLYRDGLTVYTTIDSRMQEHANRAVSEHLTGFQKQFDQRWSWDTPARRAILGTALRIAVRATPEFKAAKSAAGRDAISIRLRTNKRFVDSVKHALQRIQVGFVAINPQTGEIQAMVGNAEMNFRYGLNHVTQINRQPGSTFKPFIYTVAIDNGYSPAYQISNDPIAIPNGSGGTWRPRNFGGETGGKYTLRRGLQNSVNLVAIRTILEIAPAEEVVRYARRMGIESNLRPYPSLAIGTSEVVPLQLISSYGAFANEGIYAKPFAITRIEDRDGRVIESNTSEIREVLSKETAFIMASMLRSVVAGGTGSGTRRWFSGPAGGKTGTTQDYADAWFIGFTPNLVAGVWTGFDDRRITFTGSYGQGSVAAAPIWGRFMKFVYADKRIGLPVKDFIAPEGVTQEKICIESQNLANPFCPHTVTEYVNRKYFPGYCTVHTSSGDGAPRERTIEY